MSKQEEIKQALAAATPDWYDNGNEIVSKQNPKVGIGGFLKEEDNRLAAQAPEYIAYLLEALEESQLNRSIASQNSKQWEKAFDNADKQYLKKEQEAARLRKELEEYRTLIEQQSAEMNRLQQLVNKQCKELEEKEIILTGRKYTINRLKEQNEEIATMGIRQGEQICRLLQSEKKQYKELEEARKTLKEIAEHGGVNLRGASCAELARAYLGQEGERNQEIKKAPTQDA